VAAPAAERGGGGAGSRETRCSVVREGKGKYFGAARSRGREISERYVWVLMQREGKGNIFVPVDARW
jgi:hypothetical protein